MKLLKEIQYFVVLRRGIVLGLKQRGVGPGDL